jgi:purine-nucleoside phosphorylase
VSRTATPEAYGADAARRAAAAVRSHLAPGRPVAAIVLGSGLGGLAHKLDSPRVVPFRDVPGFPPAAVEGHAGALVAGRLAGREVLALAGRFHLYEGHCAARAGFPVRVAHALGATTLVVSNAAGGIRRTLRPGDLMAIADHVNLMWGSPLAGPLQPGDERFPDMSAPYDPALRALLHESARQLRIPLADGVYVGVLGPSYETPAEIRMLERLGADAVGMSTVPETLVARALGMRVAGVSCITNVACGIGDAPLSHAEVLETAARVAADFERLIEGLIAAL